MSRPKQSPETIQSRVSALGRGVLEIARIIERDPDSLTKEQLAKIESYLTLQVKILRDRCETAWRKRAIQVEGEFSFDMELPDLPAIAPETTAAPTPAAALSALSEAERERAQQIAAANEIVEPGVGWGDPPLDD